MLIQYTYYVIIIYLHDSDQFIRKKNSKIEIKSDVAVNLFGKRLSSAGCPCKRKIWFDHNVIIRSYVYVSSIVHATEIHLRSIIEARTCMRVYTNSAEFDAQSERGKSNSSAEKINIWE